MRERNVCGSRDMPCCFWSAVSSAFRQSCRPGGDLRGLLCVFRQMCLWAVCACQADIVWITYGGADDYHVQEWIETTILNFPKDLHPMTQVPSACRDNRSF